MLIMLNKPLIHSTVPEIFYLKYVDCAIEDGNPNRVEFFWYERFAEERRDELLKEIADAGGEDRCDLCYDGGYKSLYYRSRTDLVQALNEINDIYNT